MNIGNKITQLRNEHKMSQTELADLLDVSRQTISKWECNICDPEVGRIIQMAKIFNVTTDYLLDNDVDNNTVKHFLLSKRGRIKENKYMTLFIITLCLTFVLLIIAFVYSSSIKLVLPNPNGPVYTGIKAHLISEHHCFVKIVLGLSFCSFGFSIFFLFYKFKEGKRKKNG